MSEDMDNTDGMDKDLDDEREQFRLFKQLVEMAAEDDRVPTLYEDDPHERTISLLNFGEYQRRSKETAKEWADPDVDSSSDLKTTALFLATALNGETGELSEKIKKFVREDDERYLEEAQAELGDVLWYFAQIASLLDVDLGTVARDNLVKLEDRDERNVILGQGDDR